MMLLPDAVDVLVIGAGPAGCAAALAAARRQQTIVLADRAEFPRDKVCGCCLSAAALAELHAMGLANLPRRSGAAAVYRLSLRCGGNRAEVPLPPGAAMARAVLDDAMVDAAIGAGSIFSPATKVMLCDGEPGEAILRVRGERHTLRARVIVAATGLAGVPERVEAEARPGSRIGVGAVHPGPPSHYRAGTIHMACGRGGYVGAVRLEDGRLNLAAALDPDHARRAGGIAPLVTRVLREAGSPTIDGVEKLEWHGTAKLTRRPRSVAAERLLLAGDAAGYVEPFTGEGIAWALATGRAAGELASEAAIAPAWDPWIETRWRWRHGELVGSRLRRCGVIARALREPMAVSLAVKMMSAWPLAARAAAAWIESPRIGAEMRRVMR